MPAIDRYLRTRRHRRLASTPVLWLGQGGKEFGYYALRDTPSAYRRTWYAAWATDGSRKGLVIVLKLTPEQRRVRASIAAHIRWYAAA